MFYYIRAAIFKIAKVLFRSLLFVILFTEFENMTFNDFKYKNKNIQLCNLPSSLLETCYRLLFLCTS